MKDKPNDTPKYSIEMLFDKKTTSLEDFKRAIVAAGTAKWGPNRKEWPEGLAMPIRDGDKEVRNKKTKKMEVKAEHKGCWVIKASTVAEYGKPFVVQRDGQTPITEESDFYPGCYARAALKAHAYEFGDKFGVKFILDGVQFVRDGEALGSRRTAQDAFGGIPLDEDDGEFNETATASDSDETEMDENFM